jgi:hypothetical protein
VSFVEGKVSTPEVDTHPILPHNTKSAGKFQRARERGHHRSSSFSSSSSSLLAVFVVVHDDVAFVVNFLILVLAFVPVSRLILGLLVLNVTDIVIACNSLNRTEYHRCRSRVV